jgi:hypothetical protein
MTKIYLRNEPEANLELDEGETGNAHCDDCGLELSEPCPHCVASFQREQQEEAKFLGL